MMVDDAGQACKAGLLYFAGVFAVGFAFGGIRRILLEPSVGATWAVVIEMPVILAISWQLCARTIVRMQVARQGSDRTVMGVCALMSLLIAEFVLWIGMFGNSPSAFLARYGTLVGLIGLLGQITYAAFPLLQLPKGGRMPKRGRRD